MRGVCRDIYKTRWTLQMTDFFKKKNSCHDNFSLTKPKGEKNWRARKHHACKSAQYRELDADRQNAWFTTTRQWHGLWSKLKQYILIPLFFNLWSQYLIHTQYLIHSRFTYAYTHTASFIISNFDSINKIWKISVKK